MGIQDREERRKIDSNNGERKNNGYLHSDAKLGNGEEDVSLSMRMGSMVAEASAPAGGGTVDGLVEEARPPMLATRRRALRRHAGEEEDEVQRRVESDRFPSHL